MKVIIFVFIIFFSSTNCYCQLESDRILNRLSSPESVNTNPANQSNVDMSKGVVHTSIPIHNYKGKELDLPISLNYSTTGIKVDQVASNVGLGWNLNVGGRINRVVVDLPDDKVSTYPGVDCNSREDYWLLETKDYYVVSAPGFEDIFRYHNFIDGFKSDKDPRVKIEWEGEWNGEISFTITAPNGTKYYFGPLGREEISTTTTSYPEPFVFCSQIDSKSRNSFQLTKIVSKNNLDTYTFKYKFTYWDTPIKYDGEGYVAYAVAYDQTAGFGTTVSYMLQQQWPMQIFHNGDEIVDFYRGERDDLSYRSNEPNLVTEIRFDNFGSDVWYKKVKFNYSYFGTPAAVNPAFTDIRLKLDDITFYGTTGSYPGVETAGDHYHFDYIEPENVPSIISHSRDYLGMFNGKINDKLLYSPHGPSYPWSHGHPRAYVFEKSVVGTLRKITYPSGGFTEFEFEQNALKGGYGHQTIPEVTATVYDTEYYSTVYAGSTSVVCDYVSPLHTIPHTDMTNLSLANFAGGSATYGPTIMHCTGVNTTFLRVDETTGNTFKLITEGDGVYMIQKIADCDPVYDYPTYCEQANISELYATTLNECLHETALLFNKGINNNSHPLDFVEGGLTAYNNGTRDLTLANGTYQITVWFYTQDYEPNSTGASVRIFKKIPRTIVTHESYEVDLDETSCLVDGFRIKSITNYTGPGKFASKKMYKYEQGYMTDKVENSSITGGEGTPFEVEIYSTRGYPNSNIINYSRVFEIPVDSNNVDNGYTKIFFKPVDFGYYDCADYQGNLIYLDQAVTPFFYDNQAGSTVAMKYNEGIYEKIHEKRSYNHNEELLSTEIFTYDSVEFDNGCYECGPENGPQLFHLTYLKERGYQGNLDGKIVNEVTGINDLNYEHSGNSLFDGASQFSWNAYGYNEPNPLVPWLQNAVRTVSNSLGVKTFNYANFNGRYFVNEILQDNEIKMKYSYDNTGCMTESIRFTPGTLTPASYESYIYGYKDWLPVVKISGVRYSDIMANSTGAAHIANIKLKSNVPISDTNTDALLLAIKQFRDWMAEAGNYPDAQITSTTYNPVFGVTTSTDVRGMMTKYEYDVFGRLTTTKVYDRVDENFKIVSENSFNTRP